MRIALVIDVNRPGGGSLFVPKLYGALREAGHEPFLLSNEPFPVERQLEVPFYAGGSGIRRFIGLLRASRSLERKFARVEPDLALFLSPVAALAGERALRGTPSVYAPRFYVGEDWQLLSGGLGRSLNRWVERRALTRKYDRAIALSEDMRRRFKEDGVMAPVEVVRIGIDPERFAPCGKDERSEKVTVGYAGAFDEVKGIQVLSEAVRRILGTRSDVEFLLAGDTPEGIDVPSSDSVRVLGRLPHGEMSEFYGRCDLTVLPSLSEAVGRSALESLACGTPVVASDVGGVPEAVIHGETSLLVEPGDVEGLRDAILRLLDDPEERGEMGRRGRELVEERFDEEENMESLVDVLEDVP